MKKVFVSIVSVLVLGCGKKETAAPPQTELKVIMAESNYTVKVFASETAFQLGISPIATQTTDAAGQTIFTNLPEQVFLFAEKGCKNSFYYPTTVTLVKGYPFAKNIQVSENGTITITNYTNSDYAVYFDNSLVVKTTVKARTIKKMYYNPFKLYRLDFVNTSNVIDTRYSTFTLGCDGMNVTIN
jgi:hypothetical protein